MISHKRGVRQFTVNYRESILISEWLMKLLAIAALGVALANAQVVYTYQGNPLTGFQGSYSCTSGVGECAVSGSFSLPELLPANLNLPITGPPYTFTSSSFSFTDGLNIFNQSNAACGSTCAIFQLWGTDANSRPSVWFILFSTPTELCPRLSLGTANVTGPGVPLTGQTVVDQSYQYDSGCTLTGVAYNGDFASKSVAGVPGTWSVAVTSTKTWSTFVPVLTSRYAASTLTPEANITVSRMQAHAIVAPVGCTNDAVVEISNGTAAGTTSLTISAADNDSGQIAVNYSAGMPIKARVVTAASSCAGATPSLVNLVVQYAP
jgi:hypothetical protein